GAMEAIREVGLQIPDDISILGFDDIPQASMAYPKLTTVRQPLEQMGRVAVKMLLEQIENQNRPPRRVTLATQLVIRDSCAPPRNKRERGGSAGSWLTGTRSTIILRSFFRAIPADAEKMLHRSMAAARSVYFRYILSSPAQRVDTSRVQFPKDHTEWRPNPITRMHGFPHKTVCNRSSRK